MSFFLHQSRPGKFSCINYIHHISFLSSSVFLLSNCIEPIFSLAQKFKPFNWLSASINNIAHFLSLLSFDTSFIQPNWVPYNKSIDVQLSPFDNNAIYSRIHTPYSSVAFNMYLRHAGLFSQYPLLSSKLEHGFHLGNMPALEVSITPDNLSSTIPHHNIIELYIKEELNLKRFSGPYLQEELKQITGTFRLSPLQVISKIKKAGDPPKHRVCVNLSYQGDKDKSVNNHLNPQAYPTRWGVPDKCASIVSLFVFD